MTRFPFVYCIRSTSWYARTPSISLTIARPYVASSGETSGGSPNSEARTGKLTSADCSKSSPCMENRKPPRTLASSGGALLNSMSNCASATGSILNVVLFGIDPGSTSTCTGPPSLWASRMPPPLKRPTRPSPKSWRLTGTVLRVPFWFTKTAERKSSTPASIEPVKLTSGLDNTVEVRPLVSLTRMTGDSGSAMPCEPSMRATPLVGS